MYPVVPKGWQTDRRDSPADHADLWMVDGWEDDYWALKRQLRRQKTPNPEWRPDRLYPDTELPDRSRARVPEPAVIPRGWSTDRSGRAAVWINPVGWMLDGISDPETFTYDLRCQKPWPVEWDKDQQAPLAAGFAYQRIPDDYWAGVHVDVDKLTPRQRYVHGLRLDRQRAFLAEVARGSTLEEAARKISVSVATVRQWRKRYPEFDNRFNRVRAGTSNAEDIDDSFVSRRRYYFGFESFSHHRKILDEVESTPPGCITMILLPPEAGKTTWLEDWCSDQVALEPNTRILYVSEASAGHSPAAKVLGTLKERMTDVGREDPEAQYATHLPEWHARFGPFHDKALDKDKPWNANYIKVHKASGRRDYTFQATSWRSKIYGARCDWLILDDVQSLASLSLTEQILANLRLTFFSRPGKKGRTIIVGTRVGQGDIYERLIEELPGEVLRVVQIPALDEHGNSYCPAMWPAKDLAVKRSVVGEEMWACSYMMAPQEAGSNTFTAEMLDRVRDPNLISGMQTLQSGLVLAGIDPALGGGNAVVVAETGPTQFNVLDVQVDYNLARNERILEILRELAARHRFSELVIERNSQQRGLARDERLREMTKQFGFRIVEHETGVNKWEFEWGVGAMASSFLTREIRFPDATERCRKAMEPLRTELLAWRPDVPTRLLRQDMVMALWFTWLIWRKRQKRMKSPAKTWRTGGTPWTPGVMGIERRSRAGLLIP